MKALIMAGGGGTRLWPVSRRSKPKQILPFTDNETLLQKTYNRISQIFAPEDILISTGANDAETILKQLPGFPAKNLILEPCRRNTAAAIGLAAIKIAKQNPNEEMVIIYSDHFIKDEPSYFKIFDTIKKLLNNHPDHTVLVGIKPEYPETGYGYIKKDKEHSNVNDNQIYHVEKFVEKPDLETAAQYLASGQYLWNPGMFSWKVNHLLDLFKTHLPELHSGLSIIQNSLGTDQEAEVLNAEFPKLPAISIDYGIMEKLKKMLVIPAEYGWADIGNWCTIKDILSAKNSDNIVKGKHFHLDSEGNLIYSYTNKLIATLGIKDSIIVDTEDVLLVCPKNQAQNVRKIVEQLEKEGKTEYL